MRIAVPCSMVNGVRVKTAKELLLWSHLRLAVFTLTPFTFAAFISVTATAAPEPALETRLVTGTLAPQEALTSSVSVLDAEQIQALNKTTRG